MSATRSHACSAPRHSKGWGDAAARAYVSAARVGLATRCSVRSSPQQRRSRVTHRQRRSCLLGQRLGFDGARSSSGSYVHSSCRTAARAAERRSTSRRRSCSCAAAATPASSTGAAQRRSAERRFATRRSSVAKQGEHDTEAAAAVRSAPSAAAAVCMAQTRLRSVARKWRVVLVVRSVVRLGEPFRLASASAPALARVRARARARGLRGAPPARASPASHAGGAAARAPQRVAPCLPP